MNKLMNLFKLKLTEIPKPGIIFEILIRDPKIMTRNRIQFLNRESVTNYENHINP